MNYYLLTLICILNINIVLSQTIEFRIKNLDKTKVELSSISGEKLTVIDSFRVVDREFIRFSLDTKKHPSGFYRLILERNKWIDFVYDSEDVSITTYADNVMDSLYVTFSESNKLFYTFLKLNKQYKIKTELLQLIISRFPKDDEYFRESEKRLNELQREYLQFVNMISQTRPYSFIAKYIYSAQLPVVDMSIPLDKQLTYLKMHSLDNVDFNNSLLINSDLYSNKTIEYLTHYRNPQLPLELLEKEFMVAVDTVLNKAKVNQLVYQQITEYLIDGFKKFGFDKVLDYIVENYVIKDDLCLDMKTEGLIKRRIDQAKNLRIGKTAPDISMLDNTAKTVSLKSISTKKTLIVFYASWCPHCKELLPKLNELYKDRKEKDFEVLAISLDSKKSDWMEFIRVNCPSLINISDQEGWDGDAASNYFIYATPTMFIVDNELKVIAKPMTIEDVNRFL